MPEEAPHATTSGEHGTPTLIEHDAASTGETPTLHRSADTNTKSDAAIFTLKKSHLVWLIGAASSVPGGAAALSAYVGGGQSEAETQKVVNIAFEEAVTKMEARVDMRAVELERKVGEAKRETDDKLDNIEEDLAEIKLDMRDLKRDVSEVKSNQ